jgi:Icc-related predicted phosphoesterase
MKIQYCSDLHLEWGGLTLPGGEVLILAGDVCEARSLIKDFHSTKSLPHVPGSHEHRYYDFFYHECAKYDRVFYVMGNHCHYHGQFDQTYESLKRVLPDNVTLLEDEVVEYGGVVFLGSTLWTNANNMDSLTLYTLKHNMNDYRAIRFHNKSADIYHKLTPEVTVAAHVKTVNWFKETVPKYADRKVVVITHHAPSFNSISERYRGPGDYHMNGGYASDLSELLLDHPQIKFHVHGHVHSNFSYDIGNTRVLCCPRGYVGHEQSAENFEVGSFEI